MVPVRRLTRAEREAVLTRLAACLAGRTDVVFALVFGSFLEGQAFRDVDLGIWTADAAGPRIDLELATTLSAAVGLPVDVRRVNDAPVPFLFHVLRGRVVVARDERCLADAMERTAWAYHDIAPLLAHAAREAFARTAPEVISALSRGLSPACCDPFLR